MGYQQEKRPCVAQIPSLPSNTVPIVAELGTYLRYRAPGDEALSIPDGTTREFGPDLIPGASLAIHSRE